MKRYDFYSGGCDGCFGGEMEEYKEGEYVKYADLLQPAGDARDAWQTTDGNPHVTFAGDPQADPAPSVADADWCHEHPNEAADLMADHARIVAELKGGTVHLFKKAEAAEARADAATELASKLVSVLRGWLAADGGLSKTATCIKRTRELLKEIT